MRPYKKINLLYSVYNAKSGKQNTCRTSKNKDREKDLELFDTRVKILPSYGKLKVRFIT
ncbi:MAG: hypothetical protein PHF36_08395 [Candidatus Cloacimonetes bacterium]|nr:hypothetical protein [Candidatus Cloacimonadota bacterium]